MHALLHGGTFAEGLVVLVPPHVPLGDPSLYPVMFR